MAHCVYRLLRLIRKERGDKVRRTSFKKIHRSLYRELEAKIVFVLN